MLLIVIVEQRRTPSFNELSVKAQMYGTLPRGFKLTSMGILPPEGAVSSDPLAQGKEADQEAGDDGIY